ncbi:hypothetical protein SKAU_G00364420 [Synaphobranchus kaupii]|uniref:Uncharacterized protein n=1 Tax=Synaphobranchus kaupii TaxID=118154 RepID=A0A9Q1EES7_SYNKA|nr:hypothetical protein SKAU_G00364420 [Synaphobranchus kaupii]
MDPKCPSTSPHKQHQIMKSSRSKSTEEVQQAKKQAFHTPQKSLPGRSDLEKLKWQQVLPEPFSSVLFWARRLVWGE